MAYGDDRKILKRLISLYQRYYKWRKFDLGVGFHAGKNVQLWAPEGIKIGKYCYLGRGSQISCDVDFGDYVFTGNNVAFIGRYDHNWEEIGKPMLFSQRIKDSDYKWKGKGLKVIIEDDIWIGFGSIILSGVKVGQGSIIAAGSLVTKDVEPFSIYGGVPAIKIGNRFNNANDIIKHKKSFIENFKLVSS